jgi:hypothetical protein
MASTTWIGGGNNEASNQNDWSPTRTPQPGDTLTMSSGTMHVSGIIWRETRYRSPAALTSIQVRQLGSIFRQGSSSGL